MRVIWNNAEDEIHITSKAASVFQIRSLVDTMKRLRIEMCIGLACSMRHVHAALDRYCITLVQI